MASVHKINQVLAEVRGVPPATIEAYSRVVRREGVLPETKRGGGGPPLTTKMAGYMLAAVMRGSPVAAAENAREVGDLIVHDGGAIMAPVLEAQLKMFGWAEDMSFAGMVGWLIDRHVDGTIDNFIDVSKGYKIEVDRYWTRAWLYCQPALPLVDEYVGAWREAFKTVERPPLPERNPDGSLSRPMEVEFHTPLLHEAKISYGVDSARNREAHRRYQELRKQAGQFDVWGTESVTHQTLLAIAEVFKS